MINIEAIAIRYRTYLTLSVQLVAAAMICLGGYNLLLVRVHPLLEPVATDWYTTLLGYQNEVVAHAALIVVGIVVLWLSLAVSNRPTRIQ